MGSVRINTHFKHGCYVQGIESPLGHTLVAYVRPQTYSCSSVVERLPGVWLRSSSPIHRDAAGSTQTGRIADDDDPPRVDGSPTADKILVLSQESGRVVLCRKRMLCWDWEDAPTM